MKEESKAVHDPESVHMVLVEAAWERHHKRARGFGEARDVAIPYILGMSNLDWDRFDRNHPLYCNYWDRHGWNFCSETLLAWVMNGCCPPPPEAQRFASSIQPKPSAPESWVRAVDVLGGSA
jgi:hypothetical protein